MCEGGEWVYTHTSELACISDSQLKFQFLSVREFVCECVSKCVCVVSLYDLSV